MNLRTKIAEYLGIPTEEIKNINEWKYVYHVTFNIRRRPTLVSKKKISIKPTITLKDVQYIASIIRQIKLGVDKCDFNDDDITEQFLLSDYPYQRKSYTQHDYSKELYDVFSKEGYTDETNPITLLSVVLQSEPMNVLSIIVNQYSEYTGITFTSPLHEGTTVNFFEAIEIAALNGCITSNTERVSTAFEFYKTTTRLGIPLTTNPEPLVLFMELINPDLGLETIENYYNDDHTSKIPDEYFNVLLQNITPVR